MTTRKRGSAVSTTPHAQAAVATEPPTQSPKWLDAADILLFGLFTALSVATKFYKLEEPRVVLFDETHFGKFVNAHLTGKFYFDIHPPLVKLLMAALLVWQTDYKGDQPFENIGEAYLPTTPIWWFRFIPALSGALIVPVVFLITRRLRLSKLTSVLCTSMICFDNLILGESREILTDTSLILFVCLALLCHISAEQQILHSKWWYFWTLMTGLSLGGAISTKWTSLSVFGIVGISTLVDLKTRYDRLPYRKHHRAHVRDFVIRGVLLLGSACVIYWLCFVFYFNSLPRSGAGDDFMPPSFRATLLGSKIKWAGPKPSFSDNFWALNIEMFRANKNVNTPHHWQSYWYTWPLNLRGIACWNGERQIVRQPDGSDVIKQPFVYLLGNPFVWWFSTACLALSPYVLFRQRASRVTRQWFGPEPKAKLKTDNDLAAFTARTSTFPDRFQYMMFQLYLGWVASILPYALISRACFLYHYMPSLIFAVLISGVCLDVWFELDQVHKLLRLSFVVFWLAVFAWAFWFFAPLSYGDALTDEENRQLRWFDGWN
eukprot:c18633_g1_i2.p1 GENE.c18633_g1_i2~~c18633_g1_i2.p1  ORF type:complete len:559 (+),score=128.69 c18633_g1_i2:41-1678(+)